MDCPSPIFCQNHRKEDWRYCVLCRTRQQSASALKRAQRRKVTWPTKPFDRVPPIRDTSTCTIEEAIQGMVQYLGVSSRSCKKYFNGLSDTRKSHQDAYHCVRFHKEEEMLPSNRNPLLRACEDMCVSVDPGTYSVTAGVWGEETTQTHVVRLAPGQSANLDLVF